MEVTRDGVASQVGVEMKGFIMKAIALSSIRIAVSVRMDVYKII